MVWGFGFDRDFGFGFDFGFDGWRFAYPSYRTKKDIILL